jgi:hypothetical protein
LHWNRLDWVGGTLVVSHSVKRIKQGDGAPGGRRTPADRQRTKDPQVNGFHTTAMCSPSRASLLTGRNHHRIGRDPIAEFANDWDGYAGRSQRAFRCPPRSSMTTATPPIRSRPIRARSEKMAHT